MDAPAAAIPSYHPSLSPADRKRLAKHPHCLDLTLTPAQLQFLHEQGYLVLKNLIPAELCEKIVNDAFIRVRDTLKVTRRDTSSWSNIPFHGILNIWHMPSLYDLRQHSMIYSLFSQLMKTHKLCVSLDRVSMKPPNRGDKTTNDELPLHTDTNYWFSDPNCPTFQGGLCLENCPVGGGGFFCLPGEHRPERVAAYKAAVEKGEIDAVIPGKSTLFVPYGDPKYANQHRIEVQYLVPSCTHKLQVALERGDFVVWNNMLPHNGGRNTLRQWRLHAYVLCLALDGPVTRADAAEWAVNYQQHTVLSAIKSGQAPKYYSTGSSAPQDCRDGPYHQPPTLTPLGRKLFGLEQWSD